MWPTYTGDGINVVVVDDGMHYTHEDLTDNVDVSLNHNYNTDDTNIYDYFEWHGTAVAGLIAAKDNDRGVRGVAPEATIYGYNYLEGQGDANRADAMQGRRDVPECFRYSCLQQQLGPQGLRQAESHTLNVGNGRNGWRNQRVRRERRGLRLVRRQRSRGGR